MQAMPNFQRQPLPTRSHIHELPTQNVLPTPATHDRLQSPYPPLSPIGRDVVAGRDHPEMRHDSINKPLQYDIAQPKSMPDPRQNAVFHEMHPDMRPQIGATAKRRFDDPSLAHASGARLLPSMGAVVEPAHSDLRVTAAMSAVPMRANIDLPPPLQGAVVVQGSVMQPRKHLGAMNLQQEPISQQMTVHPMQSRVEAQIAGQQGVRGELRPNDDMLMVRDKVEPSDMRASMRMGTTVISQQPDAIAVAPQYGVASAHGQQKQEWEPRMAQASQTIVIPDAAPRSRFTSGATHVWKSEEGGQKTPQMGKQFSASKISRGSPNWRKERYPVGDFHVQPSQQQQQPQSQPPSSSQPRQPSPSLSQSQLPPPPPSPPPPTLSGEQEQGKSKHVLPPAIPAGRPQQQMVAQEREPSGDQAQEVQQVHVANENEEMRGLPVGDSNMDVKVPVDFLDQGVAKLSEEKLVNGAAEAEGINQRENDQANGGMSSITQEGKRKNQGERERQMQNQQAHQSKQPQSQPSRELSSPPQVDTAAGSHRRQLKVEDALAYLEKVKIQFADQLNVYNMFLDIMKEFKAQSIDTTEVIRRVSDLFSGHNDLILGFNTFLPPGYQIKVIEDEATGVLNTGFVGPEGFSELPPFRSATAKLAAPRLAAQKVPPASSPKRKETKNKANVKPVHALSGQMAGSQNMDELDKDGAREEVPKEGAISKNVFASRRAAGKIAPSEDNDLEPPESPQSQLKLEDAHDFPSAEKAHEFERAIGFITTIKERFADDPETFKHFLAALDRFRNEQKGIREVFEAIAGVFGPHKDLLQQFKEFLPAIAIGSLGDSKTGKRPTTIANQRRPGISKTFSQSTPTRKAPGVQSTGKGRYKARDMQFFDDLKNSLGPDKQDIYTDFIKCLRLFTEKIVAREELESLVTGILEQYPEANSMFLQYLDSAFGSGDETMEEGNGSSSMSSDADPTPIDSAHRARYLKKSVSEMGIEYGVAREVSYRLLPEDFPVFKYRGRSALEGKTLNDIWVSGTSGTEDYSFKFMRKNQNEDNLFRCEDDRYELDMLIETAASTIQKLETIVDTMSRIPSAEKRRHALAQGALSSINFSTIHRIYGETHGPEVITQLKLNPAQTVPVVINRLRKKDAHWRQARLEMNRVWREVAERNFHRSLDHRSPQFKQVDKKELSTKSLLSDILEPEVSMSAKDAEMTRARGYPIPSGGGGANHRSGAIKAVLRAARNASPKGLKSLELQFEELSIHRYVLNWLRHRISEESSNESEADRIFAGLKLLLERLFDVEVIDTEGYVRAKRVFNADQRCAVLYGDDGMYLLLRLYHILFERVMIALTLAREQIEDRGRREQMNQEGAELLNGRSITREFETKPSSLTKPFGSGQDRDHVFSVGPGHDCVEGIFEEFIKLGTQYIGAQLESGKYEERCRVLLGTDSYCLFTLDKTVAKVVKQVMGALNADGRVDESIKLFHMAFELLERSKEAGGKLTMEALEEVYSEAVVSHISKVRGPGANVMRFQCKYEKNDECQFAIHVIGKTAEEVNAKGKNAEQNEIEKFVMRTSGGREEYKKRKSSDMRDGETKQYGGRDEGSSRKRERGVNCDFVRYVGSKEVRRRRIETMRVRASNELEWRMDGRGKLRAVDETSDYFINRGRKRKFWSTSVDAKEANRKSVWAATVRKKFKKVRDMIEGKEEGNEDLEKKESDNEGKAESGMKGRNENEEERGEAEKGQGEDEEKMEEG